MMETRCINNKPSMRLSNISADAVHYKQQNRYKQSMRYSATKASQRTYIVPGGAIMT